MSNDHERHWRDSTRAIHAGEALHGVNGPVATTIVRSSTFTFKDTAEMKRWAEGKSKAYIYTRYGNPTLAVAEAKLAALEHAEDAVVAASGMAAISSAILALAGSGDEIIATRELYGGSYRLLRDVLPRFGVKVNLVQTDLAGAEELITPNTKLIYIETPTNPTLRVVDLRKVVAIAKKHKIVSLVDNTFASPALQKPIELGFDLVMHSATKYLAGHSDLIGGAIVGTKKWVDKIRTMIIYLGGCMDPEGAYLLIRGMKSLGPRVKRQSESALEIAEFLEKHPKVAKVYYPGLPSHPDHQLVKRQMSGGFGGMLAFDMKGGLPAARRVCDRVQVFLLAASLGGVESLVVLPLFTSHYKMSAEELQKAGVAPGTIRMSVGLEDAQDLIDDLKRALD